MGLDRLLCLSDLIKAAKTIDSYMWRANYLRAGRSARLQSPSHILVI